MGTPTCSLVHKSKDQGGIRTGVLPHPYAPMAPYSPDARITFTEAKRATAMVGRLRNPTTGPGTCSSPARTVQSCRCQSLGSAGSPATSRYSR
jgi:hypothetical protein